MDTTENPRELSSTEQEQIQQWLAEAETASKAEDWDRTVALYRQALEFDRYLQGVEAKLQWAIRMRDTEGLYQQGKAKLEAGQYDEALIPLRKARLMYASHYKDIDDLIVQAQSALQKQKWEKRPLSRSAARKTQRQRNQRIALGVLAGLVVIALIAILVGTIGPRLFSAQSAVPTSSAGVASTISPEQRNNM